MFTVVLRSRNKDNEGVKDFIERKKVFLVREFEPYMGEIEEEVNMYDEIMLYQKTPNGWHIITNPFDVRAIKKDYITVKKDGMLLKKYKTKGR